MEEKIAETAQTTTVFTHSTTGGVPYPGFGVGVEYPFAWDFQADSSTVSNRTIGRIRFEWVNPTDTVRESVAIIEVVTPDNQGVNRLIEVVRCYADGRIVKEEK